jgi:hypothetical protein
MNTITGSLNQGLTARDLQMQRPVQKENASSQGAQIGDVYQKSNKDELTGGWKALDSFAKTLGGGFCMMSGGIGGFAAGGALLATGNMVTGLTTGTLSSGAVASAGLYGGLAGALFFGAIGAFGGYKLAHTAVKAAHKIFTSANKAETAAKGYIDGDSKLTSFPSYAPGTEPRITPKEKCMLDSIKKEEFKKGLFDDDGTKSFASIAAGGMGGLVAGAFTMNPLVGIVAGLGVAAGLWAGISIPQGIGRARDAKEVWGRAFTESNQANSVELVSRKYPDLGYRMGMTAAA